ncbi:MAG: DUF4249 domain-containing protein [Tannerella sp.]|jgi:hypothetical protein|nr:DUF4249 domain-containing protein [Tannerella sp.]
MILKKFLVATAIIATFFSCTAPIDISTRDGKPVIVVYGCITDENKHQSVRLTESSPYFDEKTNYPVLEANVRVNTSDGKTYTFVGKENGDYLSTVRFAGSPGVTYSLVIDVDFDSDGTNEVYEAQTTMLPTVPADSIGVKLLDLMGFRHFAVNIYMQEPAETTNYYIYKYFINDTISNDTMSEFIISGDNPYNGSYLDGVTVTYLEDASDEDNIAMSGEWDNDHMVLPGDVIRLQILNIEEGYFNFIRECRQEKRGENPFFGGPPSNITTNISNGGVGYFTSYSLQEKSVVVP